ncbi:hypothetical protein BCR41DRAFT_323811 [Lobosporangium transversale]|uniref:Uncharacterized protein n=1 Tax=Lobosporangium transversale TaxID=64571 RepID=A0A1Y2GLQ4_9FUNG|nr:hypothetical protein BCR41DRAFT_323811 [Lobosporangium transversale]ORZ13351.1 hypothetical protein BCR41DRAFT_323811 [Lobosporangium transversale]|eukprot:XP_021880432.1 hypothetical protein BCR41DRAFT_323811 [Lobosporangium transversale]
MQRDAAPSQIRKKILRPPLLINNSSRKPGTETVGDSSSSHSAVETSTSSSALSTPFNRQLMKPFKSPLMSAFKSPLRQDTSIVSTTDSPSPILMVAKEIANPPGSKKRVSEIVDSDAIKLPKLSGNTPKPKAGLHTALAFKQPTLRTTETTERIVQERCFNVLWRKKSGKKHKSWDGDGMDQQYDYNNYNDNSTIKLGIASSTAFAFIRG